MCAGKIVNADGIAPTVMENHGMPTAVIEPMSCALRGRNPDNPSDRTAGINTEQRLEIGSDVANCVTTVQKNSMVIEPSILTPIRTEKAKELRRQGVETFANRELVPRTDGCSGTITTVQKDNLLQEPIKIRQATAQGYIECPPGGGFDAAYPNSKLRRGRVQQNGDVVGAITASADNHCVYEGAEVIGSMQANAMRGSIDGVSPCLTEAMGMGGGQIPMIVQNAHGYNKGGVFEDVAPTVTSSAYQDNNHLIEPSILGYTRDEKGGVENYHEREVAGTIHTSSGSGGNTDQFVKEPCGCYDNQFGGGCERAYRGSGEDTESRPS